MKEERHFPVSSSVQLSLVNSAYQTCVIIKTPTSGMAGENEPSISGFSRTGKCFTSLLRRLNLVSLFITARLSKTFKSFFVQKIITTAFL